MARNDGRIEPGQKLAGAISARAWNRAQDAADRVLGVGTGMTGGGATGADGSPNIVLIKNDSGVDVPWLGVLAVSGVAVDPSGGTLAGNGDADKKARQFATQPVLSGGLPAVNSTVVVAMEPIAQGKIGRAAASGVFACRVNVTEESHKFAVADNGFVTRLKSASCGPCELLWKETGLGDKWAVGSM
jgi:hypothetical protein